jgi:outer membrane receptor for ferrienterochelin and colicin
VDDPTPQTSSLNVEDLLPSANLTYVMSDMMNLRVGLYHSVNRPEFREFANVLYLDFNQDQNVIGNPNLGRAYVRNYDIRYEIFPQIGEVLAGSFFYKDFSSAIEERLIPAPDRYVQTWFNSPSGTTYGWELELRKSLRFIAEPLGNVSVAANYTRVFSGIECTDSRTDAQGRAIVTQATRPMQGQSPWMVNLGLYFVEPGWGSAVSLQYNTFGRRLRSVGDVREQDVYEEPRDVLDLSVTQRFTSFLEVRFAFKNLLGKDSRYTTGEKQVSFGFTRASRAASLSFSLTL